MSEPIKKTPKEQLATPVQFVKGVGPIKAEMLQRLGLRTAADMLFNFPRDYADAGQLRAVRELVDGEPASICGVVVDSELRGNSPGRSMLGVLIQQDHDHLRAIWFNQPFMQDKLRRGARVFLSGSPRMHGGRWEMVHPRAEVLEGDQPPTGGQPLPVYSLTDGLRQSSLRRMVQGVVASYADLVEEVFPAEFLAEHHLLPIREALQKIHQPASPDDVAAARRRFIYQELLVLQLALAVRRRQSAETCAAPPCPCDGRIDSRIRRLFPFKLTAAQDAAIAEIAADMGRREPMNRLLQGDVGSGKTVVAEYAILLAVAHGQQAAIMAPTEVLARQHVQTLSRDLRESRVRIGLLTGSLPAAARRELLEKIRGGEIDIIIGTHALLNEQVEFARLALVVIDEQHKFGVRQRAALRRGSTSPHYLVMTATPIPRTVSMTLFGDLDVSALREKPAGRSVVHTYLGEPPQRERWWQFFRRKLSEGRQGYVIAPLVDDIDSGEPAAEGEAAANDTSNGGGSREASLASVQAAYESLANGELEAFRLGLVHGRMSAAEKDAAMQDFRDGKTQVLLATTVVEVGVDVPNATLMTIEGGQRFGLAQLHQLRGRISRGTHPGFLCVFGEAKTDEAKRRLEAFRDCNNGFELAELDFHLRGPGHLFGLQQHGLPPFRIADLRRDEAVLLETRHAADALMQPAGPWREPAWSAMRAMVQRRYGAVLELADVG